MQKQRCLYTSTKNQSMGCTCIYLENVTILFHFQIVCPLFLIVFFHTKKDKSNVNEMGPWIGFAILVKTNCIVTESPAFA